MNTFSMIHMMSVNSWEYHVLTRCLRLHLNRCLEGPSGQVSRKVSLEFELVERSPKAAHSLMLYVSST
jgi:hypothetical protein